MRGAAQEEHGSCGERMQVGEAKKVGGWGCEGADSVLARSGSAKRRERRAKMLSCPSSVSVHSVTKTAFGPNFAGSKGCSRRIITHSATSSRRMMATVATILSLLRSTRRS